MTVNEFIANLVKFSKASPQNGQAQIMLKFSGDICFELGRADNAKGFNGSHYLILCPNEQGTKFGVREMRVQ